MPDDGVAGGKGSGDEHGAIPGPPPGSAIPCGGKPVGPHGPTVGRMSRN